VGARTGDSVANLVLDFVAGGVPGNKVGESKGNYNAYFGHIDASEDLGLKTIADIYKKQNEMLKADPRSSAIGRYQVLRATLFDLQTKLKIPATALFTPEMQDRLALQLLVWRGYDEWKDSRITDEEFAHRLSMEWASLPDPDNDGRSHYEGDKVGNHASTDLASVYAMLAKARSGAAVEPVPVEDKPEKPEKPEEEPFDAINFLVADALALLQFRLKAAGFNPGPIDGIWGPQTKGALDAWQDKGA